MKCRMKCTRSLFLFGLVLSLCSIQIRNAVLQSRFLISNLLPQAPYSSHPQWTQPPPSISVASLQDIQNCTSPERSVPWPLNGEVSSLTSQLKCGLSKEGDENDSQLSRYLREQTLPQLLKYESECERLVVFGAAFGKQYVDHLSTTLTRKSLDSKALLERHGRCFFMFCLEEDLPDTQSIDTFRSVGHTWLIPVPRHVLPYANLRRNAKLFKYHGHFLFPYAKTVVWQDAKFFRPDNVDRQPSNYFKVNNEQACVTTMSLPIHAMALGVNYTRQVMKRQSPDNRQPQFLQHCETIVEALQNRPNVTDSASTIMQQCSSYMLYVQQQQQKEKQDNTSPSTLTSSFSLDDGLLDSAFLVWNYDSEKCRTFNAELQCTLSDQLQCHSDRDQIGFPFALAQMGLRVKKREKGEAGQQRRHDFQLVVDNGSNNDNPDLIETSPVMVHMTKWACHWYYHSLNDCYHSLGDFQDAQSVAILVAGTTKRYLLDSTVRHVLKPLVKVQNYVVDYYATLTVEQGPAFRQDAEYMNHIIGDPMFRHKHGLPTPPSIKANMRQAIGKAGASLQGCEIHHNALPLNATKLEAKRQASQKHYPNQDADLLFPMLDLRQKSQQRTINGNKNMLKLFNHLQDLWDSKLVPFENSVGRQYDFVMILRDDTLWLHDFDLSKLLALNPSADAYVQSCDARDPPMLSQEISDHGILIKREKAEVVGRYLSTLLESDLDGCHKWVRNATGAQRGCNSEMLLNWILKQNNITVQRVPQSLLPFERSVAVRQKDGKVQYCFHKFCQSKEAPLEIPESIPKCKDMVFS